MRSQIYALVTACILGAVMPPAAHSQEKATPKVASDLTQYGKARVLVVMREPKLGGTRSFAAASPQSFVESALDQEAQNVSQIGTLPVAVAEVTPEGLNMLKRNPQVAAIYDDTPIALELPGIQVTPDPRDLIDVTPAWNAGARGQGQVVVVLDTGVKYDHPYLNGKLKAEACFSTPQSGVLKVASLCPGGTDVSTVNGAGLPCDPAVAGCDHGTHVTGIAVGRPTQFEGRPLSGVAPDADLVAIQIFTLFTDPSICEAGTASCIRTFPSDQLRALSYVNDTLARQFPIAAVNMSVGGGRFEKACDTDSPLTAIIGTLRDRGIATVIASGNDRYFNAISSPACVGNAIAIGATFPDRPTVDTRYSNISPEVDFLAPGTSIMSSLLSGFGRKTGTSMATPHVAGAIALLRSAAPDATVDAMESSMRASGFKLVDPRTNTALTLIDVDAARTSLAAAMRVAQAGPFDDADAPVGRTRGGLSAAADVQLNTSALVGSRRVIVRIEPGTQAAGRELSEELGANSTVRSLAPNTYLAEKHGGFTKETLGRIKERFGARAKLYSDEPQKLLAPK